MELEFHAYSSVQEDLQWHFHAIFFYKFDIYQAQGALQQCFKTLQWRFICLLWRFYAIFFIRFREPYSDILKAYNGVLKVYSGVLELEFYANLIFFFSLIRHNLILNQASFSLKFDFNKNEYRNRTRAYIVSKQRYITKYF